MSFIVPMEKPKRCGLCPCFHAEHPMHCQAVKAHKDKRIIAPYGAPIPDWCPLVEIPTPHGRLIDADELKTAFPRCDNSMDIKIASVRVTINHAPTIIEAEGSET